MKLANWCNLTLFISCNLYLNPLSQLFFQFNPLNSQTSYQSILPPSLPLPPKILIPLPFFFLFFYNNLNPLPPPIFRRTLLRLPIHRSRRITLEHIILRVVAFVLGVGLARRGADVSRCDTADLRGFLVLRWGGLTTCFWSGHFSFSFLGVRVEVRLEVEVVWMGIGLGGG